jgi:hypothetical protein
VEGQYEQACNAIDAVKAGAGIRDDHFNITKLVKYIPKYEAKTRSFKAWYEQGHQIFLEALTGFPTIGG